MANELEASFTEIQELLKKSAQSIQELFGNDNVPPPAAKARYESITKIEEAYMWLANGVQSLIAFESKVAETAQGMANEAASGKEPGLKVVK